VKDSDVWAEGGLMAIPWKPVVVVLAVVAACAVCLILAAGVAVTGSGGLGAVSAGLSEMLIEGALLAMIIATAFYARSWWRRRRARSRGPS
jgi:hypothetical protein